MHKFLFYFFSFLAISSAFFVVVLKNQVLSVLSLVLTFISTAVLWLIIQIEFLAMALILVYVGAVLVLFLFVIMMVDVEKSLLKKVFSSRSLFFLILPILFVVFLCYIFNYYDIGLINKKIDINHSESLLFFGNIKSLGLLLYTKYLFEFEVAGLLLLVGIIASVGICYRGIQNRKSQLISKQNSTSKSDRIRFVDNI